MFYKSFRFFVHLADDSLQSVQVMLNMIFHRGSLLKNIFFQGSALPKNLILSSVFSDFFMFFRKNQHRFPGADGNINLMTLVCELAQNDRLVTIASEF